MPSAGWGGRGNAPDGRVIVMVLCAGAMEIISVSEIIWTYELQLASNEGLIHAPYIDVVDTRQIMESEHDAGRISKG
jgi:hypothetical protein